MIAESIIIPIQSGRVVKITPEQFLSIMNKIDKNGAIPEAVPHLGNCWNYTGSKGHAGHGKFASPGQGAVMVHRLMFLHEKGFLPEKPLQLNHACGNAACSRVSHLYIGTHQDNMRDAVAAGVFLSGEAQSNAVLLTTARGEDVHTAILVEDQVREIRKLYSEGMRVLDIAELFPVKATTIWQIVGRRSWTHLE